MRKNFGPKPALYPQLVLIVGTYDENGKPNAMNAAWGVHFEMTKVLLCITSTHKTAKNIKGQKAFTLSIGTVSNVMACDYVGIVSGNNVEDKFAKAGFHDIKSEFVNAPIITEFPLTIECELESIDEEKDLIFGKIINVSADESILDENGNVSTEKLNPIVVELMTNKYLQVGGKVGNAFTDGKLLSK